MISLRGLECLVAIVDQGSLTKAAAVLPMSQPALSHQIAGIERELGTAVIERLPRGVRPTAAGLAAAEHVEVLGAEEIVVVAAPGHRFAAMAAVPLAELSPPELRDVVVVVAAPHDELGARFVGNLKKCGLPVLLGKKTS